MKKKKVPKKTLSTPSKTEDKLHNLEYKQTVEPKLPAKPPRLPESYFLSVLVTVLLLILLFVVGGLIGYQSERLKQRPYRVQRPLVQQTSPEQIVFEWTIVPTSPPDQSSNWITYTPKTVGLQFGLPLELYSQGELMEVTLLGETGSLVCITFQTGQPPPKTNHCKINAFGVGANSNDYSYGRGSSFTDHQGFRTKEGSYFTSVNWKEPDKIIELPGELIEEAANPYGINILKVHAGTMTVEDPISAARVRPTPGTPPEGYVGALINIPNNLTYPGLAIQMELNENQTEEIFDQILSTFKSLDNNRKPISQELPEGLQLDCQNDSECRYLISHNTCQLFCVNNIQENDSVVSELKVTCDSTLWDPPLALKCGCIENKCQLYE